MPRARPHRPRELGRRSTPRSEHEDLPQLAARPVQTNEVRRSWSLLPCFLELARRTGADELDLIELGASAGFNLLWDRYRYAYEAGTWGPADARSSSTARSDGPCPGRVARQLTASRAPSASASTSIPSTSTTEEGALRLRSFVWPGSRERIERLDRAIEAVRARAGRSSSRRHRRGCCRRLLAERAPRRSDRRLRDRRRSATSAKSAGRAPRAALGDAGRAGTAARSSGPTVRAR